MGGAARDPGPAGRRGHPARAARHPGRRSAGYPGGDGRRADRARALGDHGPRSADRDERGAGRGPAAARARGVRARSSRSTSPPRWAPTIRSACGCRTSCGSVGPSSSSPGRRRCSARSRRCARELGVEVPLIHRRTLRSVEEVIVDSMAVSFYVNNAARNTHFVERREITHVWLNHGDSEKPACFNPVHAIYDLIFAAGQAGIDRYERHGVRSRGRSSASSAGRRSSASRPPGGRSPRSPSRPSCTRRPGKARSPTAGSTPCRSAGRS